MRLKDLSADERPREKMLTRGPASLTNAELIALLLRSGTSDSNVLETARKLLAAGGGSITGLSTMSPARLRAEKGIGPGKATALLAALELGRRFFEESAAAPRRSVTSPEQVYRLMIPQLKGLDHEQCWVLYLNRSNFVVGREKLFNGGLSETVLDAQVIVRRALEQRASAVILVHNHPSGNPRPGASDIQGTQGLRRALAALELSLLDHIIVSDGYYFSFAEDRVGKA